MFIRTKLICSFILSCCLFNLAVRYIFFTCKCPYNLVINFLCLNTHEHVLTQTILQKWH